MIKSDGILRVKLGVETLEKCVQKVGELITLLRNNGVIVYDITDLKVLDTNFGSVKFELNLDFRKQGDE